MSIPKPPVTTAAGLLVPYMSARRRHEILDIVFENLGGTQRLEHEAGKDSDSFWKFMGLWGKGLPRALSTEHNVGGGVEDLLEKLDKAANAKTIDGSYTEVPDAT